MKNEIFLFVSLCAWMATSSVSAAATIPAGTTLTLRTDHSISSNQRVGREFTAHLDRDVIVNGKTVLRAGTQFSGKVLAALGDMRRSNALELDLTSVSVNGRKIPVKTTGGYEPQLPGTQYTKRGAAVYHREFIFPHGTLLMFHLAKPLNL
jgi:hypothetical protein